MLSFSTEIRFSFSMISINVKMSKKGTRLVLCFFQKVATLPDFGHDKLAMLPKFGHGNRAKLPNHVLRNRATFPNRVLGTGQCND